MYQLDSLPASVEARLKQVDISTDRVVAAARSDLAADGTFGQSWLILTDRELIALVEDHGEARRVLLEQVYQVKSEPLVGAGVLTAELADQGVELIRYSSAVMDKFAYLARYVTELVEHRRGKRDEPPAWDYKPEKKFCQRCGLPLRDEYSPCPRCTKKSRALLRILGYLKPYGWQAAVLTLFSLVGVALELVPPYFTRVLIDDILQPADVKTATDPTPLVGQWFRGFEDLAIALGIAVAMVAASMLIGLVFGIFRGRMHAWLGLRIATDIRSELFGCLHGLSLRFFDKRHTGTIISHVTHDTERIYFFLVDGVQMLVRDVLMFFGIIFVLFRMDWKLTLWVLIPVPIIYFGAMFFWRRVRSIFHRAWSRHSKLHDVVNDTVTGMRVVRAFAQKDQAVDRFEPVNEDFRDYATRGEVMFATFFPLLHATIGLGGIIVWLIGGQRVLGLSMSLGTLMTFMAYLWRFYMPMMDIGPLLNWSTRCLTAAERIFEVLDAEPEQRREDQLRHVSRLNGEVELRDLSFGYEKHKMVLRNIDLHVQPGEMIGLVGHSGAGKSTLINLICRFYTADGGGIYIDGQPINEIELGDLRSQIGVVLQDPFLFNGTIAQNIAFARPDASLDQIIAAATAANAHEFIMKMPDGYDTEVGERGSRLSGGERQRISIARAILHNPRILILDEATSSVDVQTEKKIQQAIDRLVVNRTTFAIAHRLSTLRHADRLLVLKDGKAVECGSHDELMQRKGVYYNMVKTQREVAQMRSNVEAIAG